MSLAHTGRNMARISAAADHFQVNTKTLRRRIDDGTITGYRLGTRVLMVDLDEVEQALSAVPPTSVKADTAELVRRIVDKAPPLSDSQYARLCVLLAPEGAH